MAGTTGSDSVVCLPCALSSVPDINPDELSREHNEYPENAG